MFTRQFEKLRILTQDTMGDYKNVIVFVSGHWYIRHPEYPLGAATHYIEQELDLSGLSPETFIPAEDVTDKQLEEWLSSRLSEETIERSYAAALPVIRKSHKMNSLTVFYDANDEKEKTVNV